jgi:ketosteroid isomerase-like protein
MTDTRCSRKAPCVPARDTPRTMSEESTPPDLVELTRHAVESGAAGDVDATLSHYTSESVWDLSRVGLGEYTGIESIRRFVTDWIGLYEELRVDVREVLDLGGCVTLAVVHMDGRLVGSTAQVAVDYASVVTWSDAAIVRVTHYSDIEDARAAAERLAEELG